MSSLSNILNNRLPDSVITDNELERPFRNLIINGAMQVAQRGTSVTGITGDGYFTADRWRLNNTNMGTWTQSVEDDAPTGSGFRKSVKMLCTTAAATPAASSRLRFQHFIEGQNVQSVLKGTANAQQLTATFWVKANVTGTYICNLIDANNTRHVSASYTIASSATWEKKTIVFPADTTGVFNNNNALSLVLDFFLGSGTDRTSGTLRTTWTSTTNADLAVGQTNLAAATNNYWQITGVQLEVGAVATPFEFKPFDAELLQCQRYYYKNFPNSSARPFAVGYANSTTVGIFSGQFPVTMRINPTALEQTGTAGDYRIGRTASNNIVCSAVPTYVNTTKDTFAFNFEVSSGLTAGEGLLSRTEGTNGYLAWSAEL